MGRTHVLAAAAFVGVDTSDPNAKEVEYFRDPKNHAAACATILNFIAYRVDWNTEEVKESAVTEYLKQADTFPGFRRDGIEQRSFQIPAAEWSTYMRSLVDHLEEEENKPFGSHVVQRLQDLTAVIHERFEDGELFKECNRAFGREKDHCNPLLFLQIVQKEADSDNVFCSLYHGKLALSRTADGAIWVTNEQVTIQCATFQILSPMLKRDADRYAGFFREISVEEWSQSHTSKNSEEWSQAHISKNSHEEEEEAVSYSD